LTPSASRSGTTPFSDVGFRLAFTAPRATLSQILLALLETPNGGYLTAPGPSGARLFGVGDARVCLLGFHGSQDGLGRPAAEHRLP